MSKVENFFEEVRKAIVEMPKRPPIIVKDGEVVGVKLNSATIEKLSQPNYVKPVDGNYINYLMGVKVYRDDTVSKPIYIVEGEIETNTKQLSGSQYTNIYIDEAVKPSEAMEQIKTLRGFNLVELNNDENINKSLDIINQALLKALEQEKEIAELNQHIKRWHDLLLKTGINSKGTVVDEIENYWQIKTEAKQ